MSNIAQLAADFSAMNSTTCRIESRFAGTPLHLVVEYGPTFAGSVSKSPLAIKLSINLRKS